MKILNLKKKINFSFLFLVFFFFLIVSFSLATEGILLEDFGGRLSNVEGMIQNDPSAALAAYINFLVNMAFGLLSIAAVILIIWGGIDLITGKQKYTEILTAKNKIIKGILAIIILALSFVVFERINPNILIINFSPIVEKGEIELEHGDWDKDFLNEDREKYIFDPPPFFNVVPATPGEVNHGEKKINNLIEEFSLKMPREHNLNKLNINLNFEQEYKYKILSVPFFPQHIPGQPPAGGGSMCGAASAIMAAAFHNGFGEYSNNTHKLRQFMYLDKGQNLNSSCNRWGTTITGAFAVTSNKGCRLTYHGEMRRYIKKEKFGITLGARSIAPGFRNIKNTIKNNNNPVIFNDSGHISVAIGYVDIKPSDPDTFLLIANDPWTNRNQPFGHGGIPYWSNQGQNKAILIKNNRMFLYERPRHGGSYVPAPGHFAATEVCAGPC